jgi:hypothetical protein
VPSTSEAMRRIFDKVLWLRGDSGIVL